MKRIRFYGLAAVIPLATLLSCGCSGDARTDNTGQASSGDVGGAGGSGGAGGAGGSGGAGGAGGVMGLCIPGAAESCYDGPATTNVPAIPINFGMNDNVISLICVAA